MKTINALTLTALSLFATNIAAYGANIEFYADANCQGAQVGSCLFGGGPPGDGQQCCTWNSFVGSIYYTGNGGGRSVEFWYGNDVCTFDGDKPGASYAGVVLEQNEGCWNVGNSLGIVTDTENGDAGGPGGGQLWWGAQKANSSGTV